MSTYTHANALRMSPVGLATMYGGSAIKAMTDSGQRQQTRKKNDG